MSCAPAASRRLLALLGGVLALGAVATPARAAYPGTNGAIAYLGRQGAQQVLYIRHGHRAVGVLAGRLSGPAWSPRGVRLAVTRELDTGRSIWILRPGDSELRQLTAAGGSDSAPTWAPGGGRIAFTSGAVGNREIDVIGTDGTGRKTLFAAAGADPHDPAWSVNNRIAFVQSTNAGDDVFVMNANATGVRRLTFKAGNDRSPVWSPNGHRIAWVRGSSGIWVMQPSGRGAHRLAKIRGTVETSPAWSPDGKRVLFSAGPAGHRRIWAVGTDGRGLHAVSLPRSDGSEPDWQPAGKNPVILAAGDVACDPASKYWNNGFGISRHCGEWRTSNLLLRGEESDVLVLGDEQYTDGLYSKFLASFAQTWGRVKPLLRPAVGNHEYNASPTADGYFDYFDGVGAATGPVGARGEGWYSYDVGTWHLISLNSNCAFLAGGCGIGSPQQTWLVADLAKDHARCTLAYWHHPVFSSEGDVPDMQPIFQTLYDAGADVVLDGHHHLYERFASQDPEGNLDAARGIRQITVGTGGMSLDKPRTQLPNSQVINATTFGVLRMELKPRGYTWHFESASADPFADSGAGVCH